MNEYLKRNILHKKKHLLRNYITKYSNNLKNVYKNIYNDKLIYFYTHETDITFPPTRYHCIRGFGRMDKYGKYKMKNCIATVPTISRHSNVSWIIDERNLELIKKGERVEREIEFGSS